MMLDAKSPGKIITFYSYKGGVGRSMALANVACLLAQKWADDEMVIMIDWDLEAPGLHKFFRNRFQDTKDHDIPQKQLGLIDWFYALKSRITELSLDDNDIDEKLFDSLDFNKYYLKTNVTSLYLMPAGRFDDGLYSTRVNSFSWNEFFTRFPSLIQKFADYLRMKFRYVLIDSRTGYTDISGICTSLMPEKLVVVFTPNRQSVDGVLELVRKSTEYRKQSDDLRPLIVFPLASRIDNAESDLQKEWRFGNPDKTILGYQPQFEAALKEIYKLPKCDLAGYFDDVQLQYVPRYSYGEDIAVLSERSEDRLTLAHSYENCTQKLANLDHPWERVQDLVEDADDAYYAAEYDKAIELYKQALNLDPDNEHAQEQKRKAELNRLSKNVKPKGLPPKALQFYKRSRSFIAAGELAGAIELLEQAIEVAKITGADFPEAKILLENIQNAYKADVFKKKAFEELDSEQWVKAETNLSFALAFDPSDDVTKTLLSHLRSLLKAQNLAYQRNSGIWDEKKSLRIDKELQSIIDRTNDTSVLRNLWAQVLEVWHSNVDSPEQKHGADKSEVHAARIFVSYSHKDETFKDEFVTMFAGLQRQGYIDTWQDRRIVPGEEWFTAIQKAMKECDLAVLLVSPDFIASSFIQTEELKQLFQRRIEEGLRVVPIILRPCLWQREAVIKDLQAIPTDGKAVISFSKDNGDRDQVWADICKTIEIIAAGS